MDGALVWRLPSDRFFATPPLLAHRRIAAQVVIEFESSGQWPDDVDAIGSMKAAMYLKLAELVGSQTQHRGLPAHDHLDVLAGGFAFRSVPSLPVRARGWPALSPGCTSTNPSWSLHPPPPPFCPTLRFAPSDRYSGFVSTTTARSRCSTPARQRRTRRWRCGGSCCGRLPTRRLCEGLRGGTRRLGRRSVSPSAGSTPT